MIWGHTSERLRERAFAEGSPHALAKGGAFDFNGSNIRVIEIDGDPWFPAKDVCDALGLANPSASVQQVPAHQRMLITKSNAGIPGISLPNRGLICVNEGGLYRMLFLSRRPEALDFQDWVTGTVLPAIRKDGGYVMGEEKVATGEETQQGTRSSPGPAPRP